MIDFTGARKHVLGCIPAAINRVCPGIVVPAMRTINERFEDFEQLAKFPNSGRSQGWYNVKSKDK